MDSEIGLILQFSSIFLIALLFVFLKTSLKSETLRYWKRAWLVLSLALLSLHFGFDYPTFNIPLLIVYYLGEYVFAFYIIAGCRNFATDKEISRKSWFWLIPGFLTALLLSFSFNDFNLVFNIHSFILATAFSVAFFTLKPRKNSRRKNFGLQVMKFALLVLALDFYHYSLAFTLLETAIPVLLPENYLAYNPAIDLVLEILLGFGMVIVLMERIRQDVEETNFKLQEANDKLEKLAHIDPLTTAFTRHAFYSFLQKNSSENDVVSGCVGVFDIDNLKPINDLYGHAVGDVAISTVSHAIRSLVRADDLLFRWGGDEFFAVMLGFDEEQARERMSELNSRLENVKLFGLKKKVTIKTSFGFAAFADIRELEKAIKIADVNMYKNKKENKRQANSAQLDLPVVHNSNLAATEIF